MSLLYNLDFQLGAGCLLIALVIMYATTDENYPVSIVSILMGLGLGFCCVPIFEAPRIAIVVIFLIWMVPIRKQSHTHTKEEIVE